MFEIYNISAGCCKFQTSQLSSPWKSRDFFSPKMALAIGRAILRGQKSLGPIERSRFCARTLKWPHLVIFKGWFHNVPPNLQHRDINWLIYHLLRLRCKCLRSLALIRTVWHKIQPAHQTAVWNRALSRQATTDNQVSFRRDSIYASVADPGIFILNSGSDFFYPRSQIPAPGFTRSRIRDPGSRSASKHLSIYLKKLFLLSRKTDLGCSSRITDLDFFSSRILDPDSLTLLTQEKCGENYTQDCIRNFLTWGICCKTTFFHSWFKNMALCFSFKCALSETWGSTLIGCPAGALLANDGAPLV